MPRPMPGTIAELRVPNPEYPYFTDLARRPFSTGPDKKFCGASAWRLAELSFLCYVKERERIAEVLRKAGFQGVSFFEDKKTFAFVAYDKTDVIAVFRGTDIRSVRNLATDMNIRLKAWDGPGRCHQGFLDALDLVWERMAAEITEHADGRRVWFTGHSLGAAMATLARLRWPSPASLYVFGSPRVGDADLSEACPEPAFRLVNEDDMVPSFPPPIAYRHIGELSRLRRDGTVDQGAPAWQRLKDHWKNRLPSILEAWGDREAFLEAAVRTSAIADHAPINYCVRLWNLTE